jgi:hypothetical protein
VRRAAAALSALAACQLLAGCALSDFRSGDPRFLQREIHWQPGITTVRDVAADLGPPDVLQNMSGSLIFVYRFEQERQSSFVIAAYLRLFRDDQGRHVDSTLVAAFDDAGRLLYYSISETDRAARGRPAPGQPDSYKPSSPGS